METIFESPPKPPTEMDYMKQDKVGPIGFRPTQELHEKLVRAQKITRKTATQLIVECCNESLDRVVRKNVDAMKDEMAERQKAAQEFFKPRKAA